MHCEIICVGSELLTHKVNTHISYIGSNLKKIGLKLSRAIDVGDDFSEMSSVFKQSIKNSDIVFICGGLGPTFDDLTREVLSKVINKKLIFSNTIKEKLENFFKTRGIKMPENNLKQAFIFKDAKILDNHVGTAPGQWINYKNKIIILLPGPPAELYPIFENQVVPELKKLQKNIFITKEIQIFGLPESFVEEKLKNIVKIKQLNNIKLNYTILAQPLIITLSITASGSEEDKMQKVISEVENKVKRIFKKNIFSTDGSKLQEVVGDLLRKQKKTLSIAESCSGGLLGHLLTETPGSSDYFKEGAITYSNESKIKNLNVKKKTIQKFGAVSKHTAKEMAEGIKKKSQTDFSIAITGIAGPTGATPKKPVGLVYIACSTPESTTVKKFLFKGTRSEIKLKSALTAMDILRRQLYKIK